MLPTITRKDRKFLSAVLREPSALPAANNTTATPAVNQPAEPIDANLQVQALGLIFLLMTGGVIANRPGRPLPNTYRSLSDAIDEQGQSNLTATTNTSIAARDTHSTPKPTAVSATTLPHPIPHNPAPPPLPAPKPRKPTYVHAQAPADDTASPLLQACLKGDAAYVAQLLAEGAFANLEGAALQPLHVAITGYTANQPFSAARLIILRQLLAHGARLEAVESDTGHTPLHKALLAHWPQASSLLMNHEPRLASDSAQATCYDLLMDCLADGVFAKTFFAALQDNGRALLLSYILSFDRVDHLRRYLHCGNDLFIKNKSQMEYLLSRAAAMVQSENRNWQFLLTSEEGKRYLATRPPTLIYHTVAQARATGNQALIQAIQHAGLLDEAVVIAKTSLALTSFIENTIEETWIELTAKYPQIPVVLQDPLLRQGLDQLIAKRPLAERSGITQLFDGLAREGKTAQIEPVADKALSVSVVQETIEDTGFSRIPLAGLTTTATSQPANDAAPPDWRDSPTQKPPSSYANILAGFYARGRDKQNIQNRGLSRHVFGREQKAEKKPYPRA